MAKRRAPKEEAWTNAKKICRLSSRQVEMARALGMNPRKLPGLRPSPQQRWKLPVGEFIEQRYRKRFGAFPHGDGPRGSGASSHRGWAANRDAYVPERVEDPAWQMSELVCYLMNLADDLQAWLGHASIDSEVLPQVGQELREIAKALDSGAPISPMPGIPVPPRPAALGRAGTRRNEDDDEIPF
jgi:hypothetical protein